MKKKIVVLENNFISTVTMRRALMLRLVKDEFELYILSFGKEDFADQLKEINATTINIGSSTTNPLDIIKYIKTMYNSIKQIDPDICLTFTPRQNIYGNIVCRILNIPTLSNITGTGVPFHIRGFVYFIGRILYKLILTFPRVVFFQNRDDYDDLINKNYVKKSQAILIPGSGIETEKFLPHPNSKTDKFVFLFIGRLVKIKGISELVAATKRIIKDNKECELWIVGPLWLQNTGKNTITQGELDSWQQEGIFYKGEAKDVRPFLAACDCFVLPSYREGLSNSLLEAASMEKPIVTTNVTGCRDVVIDGLNGILCKPQDAISLENAMRKMLALDYGTRLEMGRQGRLKVKIEFEKSIVVDKYIEQINKYA